MHLHRLTIRISSSLEFDLKNWERMLLPLRNGETQGCERQLPLPRGIAQPIHGANTETENMVTSRRARKCYNDETVRAPVTPSIQLSGGVGRLCQSRSQKERGESNTRCRRIWDKYEKKSMIFACSYPILVDARQESEPHSLMNLQLPLQRPSGEVHLPLPAGETAKQKMCGLSTTAIGDKGGIRD